MDAVPTKKQLKQPTRIWPGTEAKVELMAQRWEAGLLCFHPDDRHMLDQDDSPDVRVGLHPLKTDWRPA